MSSPRRNRIRLRERREGVFSLVWNGFLNPPEVTCPKCNSTRIEYYDPFFFSPIRTVNGRRRLRCRACNFIWRPSRSSSVWERLRNQFYT